MIYTRIYVFIYLCVCPADCITFQIPCRIDLIRIIIIIIFRFCFVAWLIGLPIEKRLCAREAGADGANATSYHTNARKLLYEVYVTCSKIYVDEQAKRRQTIANSVHSFAILSRSANLLRALLTSHRTFLVW